LFFEQYFDMERGNDWKLSLHYEAGFVDATLEMTGEMFWKHNLRGK